LLSAASDGAVRTHSEIRIGHPAEQIIAAADRWQADLIVTGHRGQGVFERWLLGSVSRLVIAYAHCAVLVVR
jgi:nucleotide-binding universal stress UspA family protein